ncbi:hypothetical protein CCP3SC1AL1_730009 [Gammaproteobacteria bacterium]
MFTYKYFKILGKNFCPVDRIPEPSFFDEEILRRGVEDFKAGVCRDKYNKVSHKYNILGRVFGFSYKIVCTPCGIYVSEEILAISHT